MTTGRGVAVTPSLSTLFCADSMESLARGGQPRPSDMLYLLRYGAFADGTCAPAVAPRASSWLRIDALPTHSDDTAGPVENLLTGLITPTTTIDVVLDHTADSGLNLYLGSDAAVLRHARAAMAPEVNPFAATAPPLRPGWHQLGLIYRLLNDIGAPPTAPTIRTSLLQRLSSVDGPWRLMWRIEGCDLSEIDDLTARIEDLEEIAASTKSVSQQVTNTTSSTVISKKWSRIQSWLGHYHDHLTLGRSTGIWRTTAFALSPEPAVLDSVVAACRTAIPGADRIFAADACGVGATTDPTPTSVLTTAEVSAMFAAPAATVPGLAVRPSLPTARRVLPALSAVRIGNFWGTDIPCAVAVDDFEGHGFITGTTGSGKTATVTRILAEAWNRHHLPCLILDPVKDDYSDAAAAFRGGLHVVRGSTLCMNILEPWPGTPADVHIPRVSQAFRGAFSMPSPAPYVVTQLFDTLLAQRGGAGESACLVDLRDGVDALVSHLGYAVENTANIRAAVLTRLNLLTAPVRAHRFAWPDSGQLQELLTRPTVVTLADLGDDEERAFVVLMLAMAVWSAARTRTAPKPVEHLLVLEEAHRVIPELPPAPQNDESGSALRESAGLLTSMMAEVRGFGEQVIVVDQSPARVSSDVVRNTNLKVAHRIVHPDDQAQIGGAIGLEPQRYGALGALERGQAIISTRTEPAPQLVAVNLAQPIGSGRARTAPTPRPSWPCCAGAGTAAAAHYLSWQRAPRVADAMALFLTAIRFGSGDGTSVRQYVFQALVRHSAMGDLNRECLAWAGIRRILAAERALGLIRSPAAFTTTLERCYRAWATKMPADASLGTDVRLDSSTYLTRCDKCNDVCGVRVPAEIRLHAAPRTGLRGLHTTTRRDALPPIKASLARDTEILTALLGDDAAWRLQRCQIAQAVHRAELDRQIALEIETDVRAVLAGGTP